MRPIEIREERPADAAAIHQVNTLAFGRDDEARIVDQLRANSAVLVSLVAVIDGSVVGHILYSPVTSGDLIGAGLAPMAVVPEYQRQGIGSALVRAGNQKIKDAQHPFIVVVGHPAFYPRFGFAPASRYGMTSQWQLPDEVFMVLPLDAAAMRRVAGSTKYRAEFSL